MVDVAPTTVVEIVVVVSQEARGCGNGGRGRGFNTPNRDRGQKPRFNGRCQVCFKEGHNAINCWHHFDNDYVPDEKNVNAAMHSYGIDSNWYTGTGAIDHITSELDKLVVHDKYNNTDQIRTTSGACMKIHHIGHAVVSTPNRNLHLNHVLHVPNSKKNLVSVHRLATDNNAFLEFHLNFFLIKDQATRRTLLEGKCKGGLYPLPESRREAHIAIKPSMASVLHLCDQLPYPKSSSVSQFPLDLIFSDVWGHSPDFVGRNKYYVSFIDDHNKFVWIYLLHYKSEVFEKFHEFQQIVETL
jgi:hypothetical protein